MTGSIDITFTADFFDISAHVWYHSGALQVVPSEGVDSKVLGTSVEAIDLDCVTVGSDRKIISAAAVGSSSRTLASGETLINEISGTAAAYHDQAASGTRNMDFSWTTNISNNAICVVAVAPFMGVPIMRRRRAEAA